MRRVLLIAGTAFAVVAVGVAAFALLNLAARERVTKTDTFAAAGLVRLDVDGEHGSIEVVGGAGDTVTVEARITHGLLRARHEARVEGGTLVVAGACPGPVTPWCRVSYRISVPSALAVDTSTRNGRVTLRDLDGPVTARTSNGGVEVDGVRGAVDVRTSNGSVDAVGLAGPTVTARTSNGSVDLAFAAPPTSVNARTSNGAVEIVVPDDATIVYRVEADASFIGSTDISVRTDPTSDRSILARTSNGSVTVRYPTG